MQLPQVMMHHGEQGDCATRLNLIALALPFHTADGFCNRVSLVARKGMHHDVLQDSTVPPPDATFFFNPGFWGESTRLTLHNTHAHTASHPSIPVNALPHNQSGYDSWLPTLRFMAANVVTPCCSTSYNGLEADDDWGTLEDDAGFKETPGAAWILEPCENAFASDKEEVAPGSTVEVLRDNWWWQIWHGATKATTAPLATASASESASASASASVEDEATTAASS